MPSDLETTIKSALAEIKGEIEETPAAERVPLLYILQEYEAGVLNFVQYCSQPHSSRIIVEQVRKEVESMMHGLNVIGANVTYWIGQIREKASKAGVIILSNLLSLISNSVRECIETLILRIKDLGEDIAITGYSISVGIGGYLSFGINFKAIN